MNIVGEIGSKVASLRKKIIRMASRMFSESLTLRVSRQISRSFCSLSLNVCGVFFLTFGIYSVAASVLLHVFNSSFAANVSVSAGAVMALASIPMLFSKDSAAAAFLSSSAGFTLCQSIGVRTAAPIPKGRTGHPNQGFALGIVAGTVSIALSTRTILLVLLTVTVCAASFALPTMGIMFCCAVLPFASDRLLAIVCLFTALSYIIKLLRGKRSAAFHVSGSVFMLFTVLSALQVLFSSDVLNATAWKYVIFMASFFLFCFILRNCQSTIRAMLVLALACGALTVAYCFGFGVSSLCSLVAPESDIDGAFILNSVLSLRIFEANAVSVFAAALIPLTVGMALHSDHDVPRIILWMCAASDVVFLVLRESYSLTLLSLAGSLLVLLVYGKKRVYISLCALVPVLFAAGRYTESGRRIAEALWHRLSDAAVLSGNLFGSLPRLSAYRLIFGRGSVLAAGSENSNFYSHMIDSSGIIVFLFFLAFVLLTLVFSIRFIILTVGIDKNRETYYRFDSVRSAANTRLGCIAPLCSVSIILLCGLYTDLYSSGILYMLLWALYGTCASYRRNALKEMDKAKAAENSAAGRRSAEIMIKF